MRAFFKKILNLIGPILLSVLSLFITFLILQPLALFLDPTFNLLASSGIGKIAFIFMVIFQIFLFLIFQSQKFIQQFLQTNIYFFAEKNWIKKFFQYFIIFFSLHVLILVFIYLTGFVELDFSSISLKLNLIFKIIFGFIAVFFLAWTEEFIFRGTIYPYFAQQLKPIPSMLLTSIIFMFVHDLRNPINLITKNFKLGLGLFLLGCLLNLIFIITKKLYTGMGAHAGLVFVKVLLRRMPILVYLPATNLPFWINKDLRMSTLIHVLFFILILILMIKNWKKLTT